MDEQQRHLLRMAFREAYLCLRDRNRPQVRVEGRLTPSDAELATAIRLFAHGDGLWLALKRARPVDADTSDLRQDQEHIVERGPIAKLFEGERVEAIAPLEAWKARLLAVLHPPEERLIGLVQPR